ncbi:MAG: O-antigen ligase family protein [Myxococcota bacterium]
MFAIPGLALLIAFMYLRPQEYYTFLQRAPLLYIFFAMAVGGLAIDLKLRLVKPLPAKTLIIATGFLAWMIVVAILKVPGPMVVGKLLPFIIVYVTFVTMCQSVQSFRALNFLAGTLLVVGMSLAFVGAHLAQAPYQCIASENLHMGVGVPDGRTCETPADCYGVDGEPGQLYTCERVGIMGVMAIKDRVRYRGELQDPNELALAVSSVLALSFVLVGLKGGAGYWFLALFATVVIFQCVVGTQSRGGQLAFLGVFGIYFVKRYGVKYIFVGVLALLPLMAVSGGRSGSSANQSTMERYEAWSSGVSMFKMDPIFGVGKGMFTEYHHLTAHNSYILVPAEMGFLGMILWASMLYLGIKTAVVVLRDFKHDPRAGPARTWAWGILGMTAPYCVQMMFLSLAYHTMTWVYFGMCGAFYSAVKHHAPDWELKFDLKDIAYVIAGCIGFIILLVFQVTRKGFPPG